MIEKAYEQIPEWSDVRGAVLFDIHTGKRMDQTKEKGVRVSRMDWPDANFEKWALHSHVPAHSRIKEPCARFKGKPAPGSRCRIMLVGRSGLHNRLCCG